MPNIYFCTSCSLSFDIGWYPYHLRSKPETNPWHGADLYVCLDCGTQHSIVYDGTQPFDSTRYSVNIHAEPLNGIPHEENSAVIIPANLSPRTPYIFPGESNIAWNDVPHDQLEEALKAIICLYRGSQGKVSDNLGKNTSICPRCKKATLENPGFWMT